MKTLLSVLLLAAGLASADGYAKDDYMQSILTATAKTAFEDQSAQIRTLMEPGRRFGDVNDNERAIVENRLARMQAVFDKHSDDERVTDREMLELLNAQEEVNAILTKRDANRMICGRGSPTGTHRLVNNCKRAADIEKSRRDTKQWFHDANTRTHTMNGQ